MSRLGTISAFALAALALLAAPAARAAEEAHLTVLHTTDLHGALTAWDYVSDRAAPSGLSRIATLVKRARAEGAPLLLLDAGDALQGSPLEAIWHERGAEGPEPMMAAMSRLGYDAMAVGNHEFSYGPDARRRARADATFPWLAANIVGADGTPAFAASVVRTAGALKVGIVGITTPATPALEDSANLAGLRFVPAIEAAQREVERLRGAEHCDVVVLLAHTGYEAPDAPAGDVPDENIGGALARRLTGVDLVILGHTHTVIPSLEVGTTLVTQAGSHASRLGRVDLTLTRSAPTERWTIASRKATVTAVRDSVAPDPDVEAAAKPLHDLTRAALAETLAFAAHPIAAPRGRLEDGALWELIQRAQLDATGADVSLAALPDPTLRLAGAIRRRDVMGLYPYDNTLGIVTLTGAELLATLERSARYLAPAPYDFTGERALTDSSVAGFQFDAADGVGYEIDLTRPAGQRVVHLVYQGKPVTPEQTFKVAVNSYRMNGGGGFDAIRRAPRLWRTPLGVRALIEAYLRKVGTLDGTFNRNWTLLPDYVAGPERASVDLLVRHGALPREDAMRLDPAEIARRGDLVYWIARAFGWREHRLSGAFADVPDSLEPWLDGLMRRHALGQAQGGEHFEPFAPVSVSLALDWCEGAARSAGYALSSPLGDAAFRRGLLAGVDMGAGGRPLGAHVYLDSLTRGQTLTLVANLRYPPIRVLETTDFHGAIQPGRERGTGRPIGGSVALASWIEHLRAENPEGTVLVDGGDLFQGTMISNLAFGRPVVEQMNALGYAAAAIGNHEFDWTADTLERRIDAMRFRDLGANMVLAKNGRRPRWVGSDTTVTRHGVRIAILGLCYPKTPTVTLAANVTQFRFLDDSATAVQRVPALRRAGAEVVIGVGHIPAETPNGRVTGDLPRLARGVPGVDVWLGGHSHNRVIDEVGGIPFMIAGSHGELVAVCDMRVDPVAHRVLERRARLVTVYGDSLPPDSAMQARVARWSQGVNVIAASVIGRNATTLTRGREAESTVGDLTTDAMRVAVQADIALQNSGGLRADLPEGDITVGRIYEVMPFDNTIVTMRLTGAEMKQVLEDGLKTGRVCQVSGIRYAFDASRPEMSRVTALTDTAGAALDPARGYLVACNNFMASGGDDYATLAHARDARDTAVLVRDALDRYVRRRCAGGAALDVRADGRVTRAGRAPSGN